MKFTRDYPVLRCSFCYETFSFEEYGPSCPDCGGYSISAVLNEVVDYGDVRSEER